MSLRVSVSLRTAYPVAQADAAAGWTVEQARAARDAGLDALFVGDHHATGPSGAYLQNVPLLGRLLAEWNDRPAGALFLLPLWHPVLLAEHVGTLATIATGRFVMQTAIGGGGSQTAAMGIDAATRAERFEIGLGIVRRLLAGQEVSDREGPWRIEGACVAPVPRQPVDVWIGATVPRAIDRAARLGDGWICNADVLPPDAATQAGVYAEHCAAHGREPGVVAIRRDVHVGSDDAAARALGRAAEEAGYRGFPPGALTAGGVERVADDLAAYGAMGYTDVVVRHFVDEQSAVLRSLALLGEVRERLAAA